MNNQGVIATHGGKKNLLVFSLGEYKGRRTFDIRKCYTDVKTGDVRPTKKGITLSQQTFAVLAEVILEHDSEIREWLKSTEGMTDLVRENQVKGEEYARAALFETPQYEVSAEDWKSSEFFRMRAKGGRDQLIMNRNHPFVKLLFDGNEDPAEQEIPASLEDMDSQVLTDLLVAFGKARDLSESDSLDITDIILTTLTSNWGLFLERYMRRSNENAP